MTVDLLFNLANLFVIPFWLLMIFFPNWGISKKVMTSPLPYLVLIVLYIYLISGTLNEESVRALSNPKLADIVRLFGDEREAAAGWVHFLVMDLFVGRWIYWEGQNKKIFTSHSLLLCLFVGPIGLLSHLVTAAIASRFFGDSTSTEESSPTPAS
ncbi:MAG: ABA4-like family protein [Spirulina sp.]